MDSITMDGGAASSLFLQPSSPNRRGSSERLCILCDIARRRSSYGPILEESFFRGCLLPLLAQTTGSVPAVILTALLFALLHQPGNLAHWVSLTGTGVAYGGIRVASRSTTTAALMHAIYNRALFAGATF